MTFNQVVTGSIPVGLTIFFKNKSPCTIPYPLLTFS